MRAAKTGASNMGSAKMRTAATAGHAGEMPTSTMAASTKVAASATMAAAARVRCTAAAAASAASAASAAFTCVSSARQRGRQHRNCANFESGNVESGHGTLESRAPRRSRSHASGSMIN